MLKIDNDLKNLLFLFSIFFFVFILIIPVTILSNIRTTAKDIATMNCKKLGYETYIDFDTHFASCKPLNLVCGTIRERMIYERKIIAYDFNNDNNTKILNINKNFKN